MSQAANLSPQTSLVARFAERYSVDPAKLMNTLKKTAFRQRNDQEVTDEQMMALLVVADRYGLDPFTKEIYAYNDKGAIVALVSIDGWLRIINEHPQFDGMDFHYSEEWETMPRGKSCPTWIECVIYRKDRSRPTVVREYLDECYQAPRGEKSFDGPWQNVTKRFLRHRAIIQCGRVAFGFAGLQDSDEHQRIVDMGEAEEVPQPVAKSARTAAIEHAPNEPMPAPQPAQRTPVRAQRSAAPAQRPAPQAQPIDREPGSDDDGDDTPIPENMLKVIKAKMEQGALGEADMRARFGFGYDGITQANYEDVIAWINDPVEA